jgi:hypothetical protein
MVPHFAEERHPQPNARRLGEVADITFADDPD